MALSTLITVIFLLWYISSSYHRDIENQRREQEERNIAKNKEYLANMEAMIKEAQIKEWYK